MANLDLKISAPPIPHHLLTRQRLIEKLDRIYQYKLVLVLAPAGSGKTTLLSDWIELKEGKIDTAWVSCGKQDDHPKRFWEYVISAISSAVGRKFSGWNKVGEKLKIEDLETFIDWIEKEVRQELVLVLDDYHFITCNTIHEMLTFFMDLLPPLVHIIIASRNHPPIPTGQLSLRNQLLEITKNDLRFSDEEARSFLREIINEDLSAEDAAALNSKVEGWVAGLQIAGISFRNATNIGIREFTDIFSGTHRSMMDFLAEQVLNQQPKPIQDFLLFTSILDRFNSDLCDSTTGKSDGEENLLWLEKHNLFLIPLDENHHWFRYHHLFSDFLRKKLQVTHQSEYLLLQVRAAKWFEEHDLLESAVEYALLGKDYEFAEKVLQKIEWQIWGRVDVRTLWRWYDVFPREFINSRPAMSLSLAWQAALAGDLDDMLPYLELLEKHYGKKNRPGVKRTNSSRTKIKPWATSAERYLSNVNTLRGFNALFKGRLPASLMFLKRGLSQTPREGNHRERAHALNYLGKVLYWQGDLDGAKQMLSEAAKIAKGCGHHGLYFAALSTLASIRVDQGELGMAEQYYEQCNEYMIRLGVDILVGNISGLSEIYLQQNKLEQAKEIAEKGLERAEMGGGILDLITTYIHHAKVKQALGNFTEAQASLREAYRIATQRGYVVFEQYVKTLQVGLWLQQGNLVGASYWAHEDLLSSQAEVPYFREIQNVVLVRVLLAEEHYEEAGRLLEKLLKKAKANDRKGMMIELLIIRSLLENRSNNQNSAFDFMERALLLAKSASYIRVFIDEGESVMAILQHLVQSSRAVRQDKSMVNYVNQLIAAFPKQDSWALSKEQINQSNQALIDPLSERELQVLNLMAKGNSYDLIAEMLFVAPSTVRWHVKNIFQKLNVHSGIAAIAAARELELLQ